MNYAALIELRKKLKTSRINITRKDTIADGWVGGVSEALLAASGIESQIQSSHLHLIVNYHSPQSQR